LVALFRAVLVWTVVLATVVLPRVQPPAAAPVRPVVTQLAAYSQPSVVGNLRAKRLQLDETAQVDAWSLEFDQSWNRYKARLEAEAAAKAEAARLAVLDNHPPPPAWIGTIITNAFSPLGSDAVRWAMRVAWCESRYHPNSVNSSSGASGLFQFMPGTWAGSPWHAQSPFDPVANAQAAAWLYNKFGPQRWTCQ
jgi:soluble lytic murein transglycosylase-like protein